MNVPGGQLFQKLTRLVAAPTIEPSQRAARILAVEKDIVLPIKGLLVLILLGSLFLKHTPAPDVPHSTLLLETARTSAQSWIELFFGLYVAINAAMAVFYVFGRPGSLKVVQWTVFAMGVLDSALMIALVFLTEGYDSIVYWVFPVLILRNALSIPVALPQLALNLLLCCCYLVGGVAYREVKIHDDTDLNIVQNYTKAQMSRHTPRERTERPANAPHPDVSVEKALAGATPDQRTAAWNQAVSDYESRDNRENPLERFIVLLTWAICCYGIQALFEKQKKAEAEATEFAVRQERLHTAGRLAAEIAHQIKNPLGIITNAAFCLQRSVHDGKADVDEQVQIIREEIHRANRRAVR